MTVFKRWLFDHQNDQHPSPSSQYDEEALPAVSRKNIIHSKKRIIKQAHQGHPVRVQKLTQKTSPHPISNTEDEEPSLPAFNEEEAKTQFFESLESQKATIIQDAESQANSIKEKAHKEGYEKGREEGQHQFDKLTEEFRELLNSLSSEKKKVLAESEKGILDISLTIAEKIIQTKINDDPSTFHNILKEALDRVTDKDRIIIKVNPGDLEHVRNFQEKFKKELKDYKQIDIQADPEIAQGGCIIETDLGYIDSSISTKLTLIEHALMKTHSETHDHGSDPIH